MWLIRPRNVLVRKNGSANVVNILDESWTVLNSQHVVKIWMLNFQEVDDQIQLGFC
jgi:hypothetical protein